MEELRVIFDEPACGAWNMAVDEALLHSAGESGQATLRFYSWSEPTVSLGYFQRYDDRQQHFQSAACPVVRRSTGGGAIVHDQEMTYSFTAAVETKKSGHAQSIYDLFHETLVKTLTHWNVEALLCTKPAKVARQDEPFLCFLRHSRGDLLVDQTKIAGSAQRRHKSAILQHGSVLLHSSAKATDLPGITELLGVKISADALAQEWLPGLSDQMGLKWRTAELSEVEIATAKTLQSAKYRAATWTARR